ncbi:complex I NDUFA9 subunit family protein [Loktanella sp. S4079]|uniref:complex I NDUFA9 subunit family protein n=1 Tax=Loktanella sp. S4079 TaxID=579483 RepID=UPI0005FA5C18|nr:complex I NDUFA9 subunit family protein [Loktanella sp. S4079]KJZ21212.1 3-beta hydroxysteroid dehydrogenase [Loktanella sp. S4079]
MSKLVTIFGGSGFVGRYIARRMAQEGWRVRVAVRSVNEAMFVRPYGVVGQVEPVFCNIRDDASVASVTEGADAVVNCVGLLDEVGKNTFDAVHAEGAGRIARIARELNVARMVHISAIGADENAPSEYGRTKAEGEAAVIAHFPDAVILRPSIIFGPEDTFFNRFAGMSRFGPVLPIVGAKTLFQPVYVDDVAAAAAKAVVGGVDAGVYELGGPDVLSFRALMQKMLGVVRRRRLVVNLPFWIARIMAWGFGIGRTLSFGLVKGPVTKDQVASLTVDNVVAEGALGLDAFGIRPISLDAVLPDYLWRFRPSGQYDAIKESAKNLKA